MVKKLTVEEVKELIPEKIIVTLTWKKDSGQLRIIVKPDDTIPEIAREILYGGIKTIEKICRDKRVKEDDIPYIG